MLGMFPVMVLWIGAAHLVLPARGAALSDAFCVLLMIRGVHLVWAWLRREEGLACVSCGAPLDAAQVAHTEKCPQCRARVIIDSISPPTGLI